MSDLKLYIKGQPVILKADSGIYLNYEANNLESLSERSGTLSEEFELEECHQNRQALENLHLLNSATNIPYEIHPARLEIKGNYFMSGTVSVSEVEEGYPANFSSDNADFFQRIKDKPISDIDLSDLDHAWTNANVQAANVHSPIRGYAYPLINYGAWTLRPYTGTALHYTELFPAVYVRTLLERMAAPYTLAGSLLTDERFDRMVVAFTNEVFRYRESYRQSYTGVVMQSTDITIPISVWAMIINFDTITFNPGGGMTTTPYTHYEVPTLGKYKVKVKMRVTTEMLEPELTYNIRLIAAPPGGGDIYLAEANLTTGDEQLVEFDITTQALPAGTILLVEWTSPVEEDFKTDSTILAGASFEVELHNQVLAGGQVQLDANLPGIKQDELLATIVNAFDVIIQTNDLHKTISLDLRRDMITRPEVDWTRKIDFAKRPKIQFKPEFYAQLNIFTWAENEAKDTAGNPVVDSMSVQVYNQNLEAEKTVFESPFTNTINFQAFFGRFTLPYIGLRIQQVEKFGLFHFGVSYTTDDYVFYENNYWKPTADAPITAPSYSDSLWERIDEGVVFKNESAIPRLLVMEERSAVDAISVGEFVLGLTPYFTPLRWSASFITAYEDLSLTYDTLRALYFPVLERILAKPKFITLLMRLTPGDVSTLDFMRPIAINRPELNLQGLFYLRKVNQYNPAERESVAVDLALIGNIPVVVTGNENREHSEEYSEEYA